MARSVVLTVLSLLTVGAQTAHATPIVAVDLEPALAGIQTTRTVGVGTIFDVDVVIIGDGATPYDAASVDVLFNDSGSVLAWSGPIIAGSLAAQVGLALDAGGAGLVGAGSPLASLGSVPSQPFAGGIGGAGYTALPGPFPVAGTFTLFGVTLSATAPGTSTIGTAGVFDGPMLAFLGVPVSSMTRTGALTVQGVPEPGTLALLGTGCLGALGRLRRVRRRR